MKKGAKTRQKIITQAASVFNTHGYEGTTLSQLMAATGLEKGGIYRHFSNKEELATESFKYAWDAVLQTRLGGIQEIPSALGKLRQLIDNFVDLQSPIPGGCPLLNTATDCDDGNPALRDLVQKTLRRWRIRIAAIVEGGIRTGEIQPLTSPRSAANVLISTLEGAIMIAHLEGNADALHDARAALFGYLDSIAIKI